MIDDSAFQKTVIDDAAFQNTVTDDAAFLLPSQRLMECSDVSCKKKKSHLMGKLSKLAFLGYDFQHSSFLLNSFCFCFLPDVTGKTK